MNEVVTPTGEPRIATFDAEVSPSGKTTEDSGSGTHEHDSLDQLEERSEREADPDERIASVGSTWRRTRTRAAARQ